MDPIQPIAPRIPSMLPVEPVDSRVDPDRGKREEKKRERRERERGHDAEPPDEADDGLPHIDVSV